MSFFDWARTLASSAPAPLVDPAPDIKAELEPFEGPLGHAPGSGDIPRNRTEVYARFGNPGVGKVDPKWERANMVVARGLPGGWNKGAGKLYVHRLAEPYLREALRRCLLLTFVDAETRAPFEEIDTIGCFCFRHQRHDPSRPLSYHSWGIAVDINSPDNAGWYEKDPPAPYSNEWRLHYPRGISAGVSRAFESCGWKWGGRWKGFVDPMHFELTA